MNDKLLKAGTVGILIVAMVVAGCVAQKKAVEQKTTPPTVTQAPTTKSPDHEIRTLEVHPTIEYYPLGGYTGKGEEALYILLGDIDTIKESLEALVTGKALPATVFTEDEILNLVVFRGVFSTGGHGVEIDKVEKADNTFIVHATFTDPGVGMMVTQAFTQPTAMIPIGKLAKGEYEAKLKVTRIVKEEGGDKILEENKEHASIGFITFKQLSTEEDFKIAWGNYLKNYLSEEYIREHFEIKGVHIASKPNIGSVFYVIEYGGILAHTRTASVYKGGIISGLTRITDSEVEEYHGPLREYELRIPEETARSIMQENGCTGLESLTLTIGDYTYKGGKYPDDYGMEGFYWGGGRPENGRIGDECMVDAENGAFKIKFGAPM